jgi:hypothetical protein
MLIIFGMRNRVHQHGPCVAASCPRCHNEVVLVYLIVTRWFTLFFIPVLPTQRRRMLVCPICSWKRDVPKESEHLAVEMIGITSQWKTHELDEAEYGRRVDAFWSFVTNDASSQPSNQPPGPSQSPPAPPAPPPAS